MIREKISAKIFSMQDHDDSAKQGALYLIQTGRLGQSDGPAQRLLNYAVAGVLSDLIDEMKICTDPVRLVGLVQVAAAVRQEARTQREKNIPAAYQAVEETWQQLLRSLPSSVEYLIPESVQIERRRLILFNDAAEVATEVVTPHGKVRVEANRPARSTVWWLRMYFPYLSRFAECSGYFATGVLSAKSLSIQAAPLYDADGHYWGVEVLLTVQRRIKQEYYGGEFRFMGFTPEGFPEYRGSNVGRYLEHVVFPHFPAVGHNTVRQGDVVFSKVDINPEILHPSSPPNFVGHIDGYWCPHLGDWILMLEHPRVITHPDHPSIHLGKGQWMAQCISQSVIPIRAEWNHD
jgi:hypothetical protein